MISDNELHIFANLDYSNIWAQQSADLWVCFDDRQLYGCLRCALQANGTDSFREVALWTFTVLIEIIFLFLRYLFSIEQTYRLPHSHNSGLPEACWFSSEFVRCCSRWWWWCQKDSANNPGNLRSFFMHVLYFAFLLFEKNHQPPIRISHSE